MKRALLLMTGGAVALIVGAANAATTSGKLISADTPSRAITIETDSGKRFLFTVNDATKIEQEEADVALGDLRKFSRVTVTSEQAPKTEPLVPVLASRVQVDEMGIAAPAPAAEPAAGTARVDSAGKDGGLPIHTALVESADAPPRAERLPTTMTPLPLLAALGAGCLATGVVLWLRRRRS